MPPPIRIDQDTWVCLRANPVLPAAIITRQHAQGREYFRAVSWDLDPEERHLIGRYASLGEANDAVLLRTRPLPGLWCSVRRRMYSEPSLPVSSPTGSTSVSFARWPPLDTMRRPRIENCMMIPPTLPPDPRILITGASRGQAIAYARTEGLLPGERAFVETTGPSRVYVVGKEESAAARLMNPLWPSEALDEHRDAVVGALRKLGVVKAGSSARWRGVWIPGRVTLTSWLSLLSRRAGSHGRGAWRKSKTPCIRSRASYAMPSRTALMKPSGWRRWASESNYSATDPSVAAHRQAYDPNDPRFYRRPFTPGRRQGQCRRAGALLPRRVWGDVGTGPADEP